MLRLIHVFSIAIFLILLSCNEKEQCIEQPDLSGTHVDLDFISLEHEFLNIDTEEELSGFLNTHPVIGQYFLPRNNYPDEATFYREYLKKLKNPHIDSLQMEVKRVFGDGETLKKSFEEAFRHLKFYYPEVQVPKIKTIATGFDQDMYISDSLIIVGLDFYLGKDAKYRPLNVHHYMLRRYQQEYIVPSAMLIYGISPRFNKTDVSDKSVLAEMISYGKSFYFAKHMMPCTPDSILIWYSTEELEGVRENASIVWAHFVENEILFDRSHEVKRKYIHERPKTYEIGEAAPGRIGTWLGWEIIKAYMEEKEGKSLQGLMKETNAQEILRESNYKP